VSRSDEDRLLDIVAAIEAIGRHVERGSLDDGLVFDAVRARLMEIGEAVKDVDPQLLAYQPSIPWRRIAAMRDQLAHRYFDTSHAIVASTVANDLAELKSAVENLRAIVRAAGDSRAAREAKLVEEAEAGFEPSTLVARRAGPRGVRGMPDTDVARVRQWCRIRVPAHLQDQVRVEVDIDVRHLTIVECRPPWNGVGDWTRLPVARLRFTKVTGLWSLYWRDSNARFHLYDRLGASANVQTMLDEIEQDPTAIFWG
jgi:uncharacterized protein with HEPN domain